MSNGNMYEGVLTWNPLGGDCSHHCSYCSSKAFMRYPQFKKKYVGKPLLSATALCKKLGKGKTIFVVAQNDMFAENIPEHFIDQILYVCKLYPDNHYIFQSKNPKRMLLSIPKFAGLNYICGTTIESNRHYPDIYKDSPPIEDRVAGISFFKNNFVTIEPILQFNLAAMVDLIKICQPQYVNVGSDSKNNHLPEPSKDEVLQLIAELSKFTKVVQKTNLKRLLI